MKTKLEMAHEYAMQHLKNSGGKITMHSLCSFAWEYADAMQAEADKRKPSGLPNVLRGACGEIVAVKVDDKEWQPDWSQAPEWAKYFTINSLGIARFWDYEPTKTSASWFIDDDVVWRCEETTIFNHKGDWRESLRKRPQ